ncbi:MAG: DUF2905 domain-containing protein [Williamsia sp.]|nr:DUF2905 domain-containing protein [Williamsia sp.]
MGSTVAKVMIVTGILLVIGGTLVYFFHGKLHWIGRLPGDVRIERENFRFYFPFTTMILVSVLLTLVLRIANRLFH